MIKFMSTYSSIKNFLNTWPYLQPTWHCLKIAEKNWTADLYQLCRPCLLLFYCIK